MVGNTARKRGADWNSLEAPLRVFVTEGSPESGERGHAAVREIREILESLGAEVVRGPEDAGLPVRLGMLDSADAMLIVRTGPSESAAFEIAYNVFGGPRVPMFFALWKHAAASGSVLELEQVRPAESAAFGRAEELRGKLKAFLKRAAEESRNRERRMIRMMERLVA
jgi:hypothetical protein